MASQSPRAQRQQRLLELKARQEDANRKKVEAQRSAQRELFAACSHTELVKLNPLRKRTREVAGNEACHSKDTSETESVRMPNKRRVDDGVSRLQNKSANDGAIKTSSSAVIKDPNNGGKTPQRPFGVKNAKHTDREDRSATVDATNRKSSATAPEAFKSENRVTVPAPPARPASLETVLQSSLVDEEDEGPVVAKSRCVAREKRIPSRQELELECTEALESRRDVYGYQGNARLSKKARHELARTKARMISTRTSASDGSVSGSNNSTSCSKRTRFTKNAALGPKLGLSSGKVDAEADVRTGRNTKEKPKAFKVVKHSTEYRDAGRKWAAAGSDTAATRKTSAQATATASTARPCEESGTSKKRCTDSKVNAPQRPLLKVQAKKTSIYALYHSQGISGLFSTK